MTAKIGSQFLLIPYVCLRKINYLLSLLRVILIFTERGRRWRICGKPCQSKHRSRKRLFQNPAVKWTNVSVKNAGRETKRLRSICNIRFAVWKCHCGHIKSLEVRWTRLKTCREALALKIVDVSLLKSTYFLLLISTFSFIFLLGSARPKDMSGLSSILHLYVSCGDSSLSFSFP